MNKTYQVVYSKARGKFVAVSEFVRACAGGARSSRLAFSGALTAALGTALLSAAWPAGAASYTGSVGEDGKVTIDLGDLNGDSQSETLEIGGIGLVVFEVTDSEGKTGFSLKSPNAAATEIGRNTNVLGSHAHAKGSFSNAIGNYANADGSIANAIGNYAEASGLATNAIGSSATADKDGANAFGYAAQAKGFYSNAIGYAAKAMGAYSEAFGNFARADGGYSIAIGHYATAAVGNSIALGRDSVADEENTLSVGRTEKAVSDNKDANGTVITRRIVNVAEGTSGSNAATVSQIATVESESGLLVVDGKETNQNGSKKYKLSLTMSDDVNGAVEGLVTNKTVKAAFDAFGEYSASGYLSVNASDAERAAPSTPAKAIGAHSLALGESANAASNHSIAMGFGANTSGETALSVGYNAQASGKSANAMGASAIASGIWTNAIGYDAQAKGMNSNAIGASARAEGSWSNAIGYNAQATDKDTIAVGSGAVANSNRANAFGSNARATSADAIAMGFSALASGTDSSAIGYYARAAAQGAIALGTDSVADEANTLSVGRTAEATSDNPLANGTTIQRRIVNVAEGTSGSNAATVSQTATIESVSGSLIKVDGTQTNSNGSKKYQLSLTMSDDVNGAAEGLVTNKTVKAALDAFGEYSGSGYLSVNASDTVRAEPATSAKAMGAHSLAVGEGATATHSYASAIGFGAQANGDFSYVMGHEASSSGDFSNVIGFQAKATENVSNAIGYDAQASGIYSNAIGFSTRATNARAIAFGTNAEASGASSSAIGYYAVATGANAFALGSDSVADEENTISVGRTAAVVTGNIEANGTPIRRRIVNVAEGTSGSNAATVSQTATVESESGLLVVDGKETNQNGSKKYKLSLKTGDLTEGSAEGLVTNTTVKAALQDYAKADASNITSGSANQAAWLSALGADSVASGSKMLITSGAVYKEVRVEANGNYVRAENTAAQNLSALDAQAKKNADAAGKAQTTADDAVDKAKKAQETADKAVTKADKAQATAEKAETKADKAQATAEKAEAKADKAQATAEKAEAKADKAQATAEKAEAKADKAQETAEKADAKAEKAQTTAEEAKDAAKKAQATAEKVDEKTAKAQDTAEKAQARANEAMTEAKKHAKVTASGGLQVTRTDGDDGATYDVSIAEDADFTVKQTAWKGEDGKISTANSSGFFSGGASAENADAYVSKGVVSAGTDAEKKIVLDGNTGKATFGKTVTIDGSTGKISGLAAGEVSESSTEAVNGSQLYAAEQRIAQNAEGIESLGRAVNKVDRKIDRTGALAAALAALHPQDYDEDHPVSGAVGIGHYKGKQALAAGMFVRPVENFMVSLGASGSADDYMLNFGASFRFGGASMQKSPVQMAAKLSDQEVTIRDLSAQNQVQKTRLESQDAKLEAQRAQLESQNAKLESQAAEIEKLKAMMAKIQAKLEK